MDKELISGINEILSNYNGNLSYQDKLVIKGLARIFNEEPERWITTKTGAHIPIFKGETEKQAIDRFINESYGGGYSEENESKRAQGARARGFGTVKELAKELGINQTEAELLHNTEWHHTGKKYKITLFYPIEAYTDLKNKGKISEESIKKYDLNDDDIKALTKSYKDLEQRYSKKKPAEILEPYIEKYKNDEYLQEAFKEALGRKKANSLSIAAREFRMFLDDYLSGVDKTLGGLEKSITFFSKEEREKRKAQMSQKK